MKQFLLAIFTMMSFSMMANHSISIEHVEPKPINTTESVVLWTGKKVTGLHRGTIAIKSGNLEFNHGTLTGGKIIMDMNSITCTGLAEREAQKLEGHLKSNDFFGVPNNPTAEVLITKVNLGTKKGSYTVTADCTIKGITKSITFEAEVSGNSANAKIMIDRTDFDIRYGSGSFFDNLGDKTIYNDFELDIQIKF